MLFEAYACRRSPIAMQSYDIYFATAILLLCFSAVFLVTQLSLARKSHAEAAEEESFRALYHNEL